MPHQARSVKNSAIAARPWYSSGSGGMVSHASSVSSATTRSMSALSNASTNRPTSSRSRAERGTGARSASRPGRRASSVALARCRALFTDVSLLSSMSATSAARKPITSRSTSAARCRGGSCCSPATNARASDSLVS